MYTVYILYSQSCDKTYVGYTSDLLQRFRSHNEKATKGFTIIYRPWKVIYCEYFADKTQALKTEKQLKQGQGRIWLHHKIKTEYKEQGFISA